MNAQNKRKERLPIDEKTLSQFIGTTGYHKWICNCKLTDGSLYVADNGAAWACDIVATLQSLPVVKNLDFQTWEFEKQEDNSCTVSVLSGDKTRYIVQKVPYTDLPVKLLKFYCQGKVIFLPSEY